MNKYKYKKYLYKNAFGGSSNAIIRKNVLCLQQ